MATFPLCEHVFDNGRPGRGHAAGWLAGRPVSESSTTPAPREPEHRLDPPVPVLARIMWQDDDEEYVETEAAGWTGRLVYVRVPDTRYRLTSVWLAAEREARSSPT